MVRKGDEEEWKRSREGWTANCVGGGTVHMSGFFLRMHPVDFEIEKSRFGVPDGSAIEDWPISYAEFAPWYDRIETLLGVGGKAGANPFEPARGPYPLPPVEEHPFVAPFDAAARRLGWHAYPTPRAILSRPYAGRPPCNYCGYCGNFGCEIGTKSSVLAAFIPRAEATGNCRNHPGRDGDRGRDRRGRQGHRRPLARCARRLARREGSGGRRRLRSNRVGTAPARLEVTAGARGRRELERSGRKEPDLQHLRLGRGRLHARQGSPRVPRLRRPPSLARPERPGLLHPEEGTGAEGRDSRFDMYPIPRSSARPRSLGCSAISRSGERR